MAGIDALLSAPVVVRGAALSLVESITELLPATGAVAVQRDSPGRMHTTRRRPTGSRYVIATGSGAEPC